MRWLRGLDFTCVESLYRLDNGGADRAIAGQLLESGGANLTGRLISAAQAPSEDLSNE